MRRRIASTNLEDGGVGADAEGEREGRDGGEAGGEAQLARRRTEAFEHVAWTALAGEGLGSSPDSRNRAAGPSEGDGLAITYGKAYDFPMNSLKASEARERLYRLLDETAAGHEPVLITGPRSNAVLVGEEDWHAIQETLHLLSVPGMRESIREGMTASLDECETDPGW